MPVTVRSLDSVDVTVTTSVRDAEIEDEGVSSCVNVGWCVRVVVMDMVVVTVGVRVAINVFVLVTVGVSDTVCDWDSVVVPPSVAVWVGVGIMECVCDSTSVCESLVLRVLVLSAVADLDADSVLERVRDFSSVPLGVGVLVELSVGSNVAVGV